MKIKEFYKITSQLDLPYQETNIEQIQEIFYILEKYFGLTKNSKQKLIDLGAGDGRIVIYAALTYGITSIGVEINSTLIEKGKKRIKSLKNETKYRRKLFRRIKIRLSDLFEQNLGDFDFIYTFSLPTMHRFLNHVFLTVKEGAIVISYKYPLEIFESYLKLEHTLTHENAHQEISTFFYRKFV